MFGVATASYQVEGGWNEDGKGENVWDYITHLNPSYIYNNDSGDVACDTYHKWKEDVVLLKDFGVNHYRFSLSWSRILPTGFSNTVNAAGVNYYKNLIKELRNNGIEPVITLHHWDFPQPLQDIGGWTNPDMVNYFADYSRIAFKEFGGDVKFWTTFNEPKQTCEGGYGDGTLAPGIRSPGVADYICVYVVLLAHAKAYHIYDEEFRPTQNGSISIVIDAEWAEPASNSTDDMEAAERRLQFTFGLYANPIFNGNWPQVVIDRIKLRSEKENFSKSRLPEFTVEEIAYIKGTYDYFGFNSYSSSLVENVDEAPFGEPSFNNDQRLTILFLGAKESY
ncbi:hypothetical protein NQ314_012253 [Rhamnusium bicolor]|uniref:Uncharacterized protein n=1 Tax=Rhamnusium bicolor TaxID=1586634 RepID=A0AAV8XDR2_9CUCU|nr:hypothetical protein NQ314_012253 [Rhamnusium bicolor]